MIINGVACDNQKCTKGYGGKRVEILWSADEVRDAPEKMPDPFFKFISIQPNYEEPSPSRQSEQPKVKQFCSPGCAREYLINVVPPLSPREQAAIAENNKKVEDARKEELIARAQRTE